MKNVTIINHGGLTRLLLKVIEENGKKFPFLFHATTPEEKRWAYRLLLSDDPEHLTEEQLTQSLKRDRASLRADWEEQVGHPVGMITIYPPSADGKSEVRQARLETGPELGLDMQPLENRKQITPPAPAKEEFDNGMSF